MKFYFHNVIITGTLPPNPHIPVNVNQPANLSFTGPIHTTQFDHNGGTFQSPIHKVSLVVPPNALSDGEKVTVYMGATTSGPFDLPEQCKLRSAVVWLSVSPNDVVFKRSVSVIVPHSAVCSSYQRNNVITCVICEDLRSSIYKFSFFSNSITVSEDHGCIQMNNLAMVAIVGTNRRSTAYLSSREYSLSTPSAIVMRDAYKYVGLNLTQIIPLLRCLAKVFWPRGELPSSFIVDIYYIQNLPTELYKVTDSLLLHISYVYNSCLL